MIISKGTTYVAGKKCKILWRYFLKKMTDFVIISCNVNPIVHIHMHVAWHLAVTQWHHISITWLLNST